MTAELVTKLNTHRIEIKPIREGEPLSESNAVVLLDGEPMKMVQRIEFSLGIGDGMAVAKITVMADMRVQGPMAVQIETPQ
jgi:hypothetical protein